MHAIELCRLVMTLGLINIFFIRSWIFVAFGLKVNFHTENPINNATIVEEY